MVTWEVLYEELTEEGKNRVSFTDSNLNVGACLEMDHYCTLREHCKYLCDTWLPTVCGKEKWPEIRIYIQIYRQKQMT